MTDDEKNQLNGFLAQNRDTKEKYMSDDEIEIGEHIMAVLNRNSQEIQDVMSAMKIYEDAYNGNQAEEDAAPNTRINIVHPNVEGQVADISLQEIGAIVKGRKQIDDMFADWIKSDIDWTLDHQDDLTQTKATFIRRFLKGFAYFKVCFNIDKFDGFGLAEIETPTIDRVFIDQKITSPLELQKAEYIGQVINCSRSFAEMVYGEDKANDIVYGEHKFTTESIFDNKYYSVDDETSWILLQYWDRYKGWLRCREYTTTGMLLWDSCKGMDRKENQKGMEVKEEPIYTFVDNRYPFVMRNCYTEEGQLYGYGDTKLINNIQTLINNIYDNIRRASRPPLTLVDTRSDIEPSDIEEDSFTPIPFEGGTLMGDPPTREVSFGTANNDWWKMLDSLIVMTQRITRYSDLMIGQSNSASTATEASLQNQQGGKATNMKQKIVEGALKEVINYCVALDLQFRSKKQPIRSKKNKNKLDFIDYDLLKAIPESTPIESATRKKWLDNGFNESDIPDHQILTENGKTVYRKILVDIEIILGAIMPHNPATIANTMVQFASLTLISEDGTPRPAITWEEFRDVLTKTYGMPLEDAEVLKDQWAEYEKQRMQEQARMIAEEQQKLAAKQQGAAPSALPNGSAKTITEPSPRELNGVMQGQADFKKMTA